MTKTIYFVTAVCSFITAVLFYIEPLSYRYLWLGNNRNTPNSFVEDQRTD